MLSITADYPTLVKIFFSNTTEKIGEYVVETNEPAGEIQGQGWMSLVLSCIWKMNTSAPGAKPRFWAITGSHNRRAGINKQVQK